MSAFVTLKRIRKYLAAMPADSMPGTRMLLQAEDAGYLANATEDQLRDVIGCLAGALAVSEAKAAQIQNLRMIGALDRAQLDVLRHDRDERMKRDREVVRKRTEKKAGGSLDMRQRRQAIRGILQGEYAGADLLALGNTLAGMGHVGIGREGTAVSPVALRNDIEAIQREDRIQSAVSALLARQPDMDASSIIKAMCAEDPSTDPRDVVEAIRAVSPGAIEKT